MSASDIVTIDITCPCRGKVNKLTLGGIEARRKVNGSACHAPLGTGSACAAVERPTPVAETSLG